MRNSNRNVQDQDQDQEQGQGLDQSAGQGRKDYHEPSFTNALNQIKGKIAELKKAVAENNQANANAAISAIESQLTHL